MISPDSRSLEWIEKAAARIPDSFSSRLNQLKFQNPEAFFYWLKTSELLSDSPAANRP